MPGIFISFEGPEGAGKSTQVRRLIASLEAAGHAVLSTREPGGTPLGDRVRQIVLLEPDLEIAPVAEFLLYSAARAQIVQDVIRPALDANKVVIVDRYSDSTLAYQGYGRGLNLDFLREVTWEATGGLRPHITVLLDLEPEVGLRRAAQTGTLDRLERADLGFHRRVRAGFLELARLEPERFLVLDALEQPEVISEVILAAVSGALDGPGLIV
jgi:dTMP kinase